MKRILTVICALVLFVALSSVADAQVPFVQVFFDDAGTVSSRECPTEQIVDTLTVYAFNLNMTISSIEYTIEYSPALSFCGDVIEGRVRVTGNSEYGIIIEFRDLLVTGSKCLIQKSCVVWFCTDCAGFLDTHNFVFPNLNTGKLGVVRDPDGAFINVAGFASTTCEWVLPVSETTWGRVKSLY